MFIIFQSRANSDEEKKMNASYIISIARKLGCSIFLLPEDITEVICRIITNYEFDYIYSAIALLSFFVQMLFIYHRFEWWCNIYNLVSRWIKKWSLRWPQASCTGFWNNPLRTDLPGYRIARRLANWRRSQIRHWTTLLRSHPLTRMDIYKEYIICDLYVWYCYTELLL